MGARIRGEVERAVGLEPTWPTWKAGAHPLDQARLTDPTVPHPHGPANAGIGGSSLPSDFFANPCSFSLELEGAPGYIDGPAAGNGDGDALVAELVDALGSGPSG